MSKGQNFHCKMFVKHLSIEVKIVLCVFWEFQGEDWTRDLKMVDITTNLYLELWTGGDSQESKQVRECP